MYSIIVRDMGRIASEPVRTLAVDIERIGDAWAIARHLAASYDEHGLDVEGDAYWFRDESGLHHIWAEPDRACALNNGGGGAPLCERVTKLLSGEADMPAQRAA